MTERTRARAIVGLSQACLLLLTCVPAAATSSSENFALHGGRFLSSSGMAEGTDYRLSDSALARRFGANLLPMGSESFSFMPGSSGAPSGFGLPPGEIVGLTLGRGAKRCTIAGNVCTSDLECLESEETCVASSQLAWIAEPGSQAYNVYRSSLAASNACWWYDVPDAAFVDFEGNPVLGSVFHYLVTGTNPWGESSLGSRSSGATRPNDTPCP